MTHSRSTTRALLDQWEHATGRLERAWSALCIKETQNASLYTLTQSDASSPHLELLYGDPSADLGLLWDPAMSRHRRARWCPQAPQRAHMNQLSSLADELISAPPVDFERHALFYSDERFVGHLCLGAGAPAPSPAALEALRQALGRRARVEGIVGHCMTSTTQRLLSQCGCAQEIMASWDWPALQERLRDEVDRGSAEPVWHGSFMMRARDMVQGSKTGYLWTIERPGALRLNPFMGLSEVQRTLCDRIDRTQAQLARELELSVDGIKYHLKHIYEALGVSTKAELAFLYAQHHPRGMT